MKDDWHEGIDDLAAHEYWEAHEAWEQVWRSLDASAARECTQALIQFAAACYKIRQADGGRPEPDMQDGMVGLVDRARDHLDDAASAGAPEPSWEPGRLRDCLTELENLAAAWRAGEDLETVEREAEKLADALAQHLRQFDAPTAERLSDR